MKKEGLLFLLLMAGSVSFALSLFVYGGLVYATKTCTATSNEQYSYDGFRESAKYLVNVDCSGQTAVANSQVHWNGCYVRVNDTVTVEFYHWYGSSIIADTRC